MPENHADVVMRKIEQYAIDPALLSNMVAKLQGCPGFRLRVNDYRVIFQVNDNVLAILDIGQRGGVYG
jgi:mRNA interferase RelE/StbE